MSSFIYLTSFGAQTLHNGSTHRAMGMIQAGGRAEDTSIRLPNGTFYDPFAGAAPVIPQPFTSQVLLAFSTTALLLAEFEALIALKGTTETLTATKMTSGTLTCDAYLLNVRDIGQLVTELGTSRRVELEWRPLEEWS